MLRRVILESLGPNPWSGQLSWERGNNGGFNVTISDLQYWADTLGVPKDHGLNPKNGMSFKEGDGSVIIKVDDYKYSLEDLMDGSPAYPQIKLYGQVSDWGGQKGSREAREGTWGAQIYVDGPYGGSCDDLADPINLRNPENKDAFTDLFKNWLRYANGDTKGAL